VFNEQEVSKIEILKIVSVTHYTLTSIDLSSIKKFMACGAPTCNLFGIGVTKSNRICGKCKRNIGPEGMIAINFS